MSAELKVPVAFREHVSKDSELDASVQGEALICVAGTTRRTFFLVKVACQPEVVGRQRREVLSIGRWRTAGVLFGTSTNARFIEVGFDASRTMRPQAVVYGPWRIKGPFRVLRFVDRLSTPDNDATELWQSFVPSDGVPPASDRRMAQSKSAAEPDVDQLYSILRSWAQVGRHQIRSYLELSLAYRDRTGEWFDPDDSWDALLGQLNRRICVTMQGPALSALVVRNALREPGDGFWGSASNVPERPPVELERFEAWARIVKDVLEYEWPETLGSTGILRS